MPVGGLVPAAEKLDFSRRITLKRLNKSYRVLLLTFELLMVSLINAATSADLAADILESNITKSSVIASPPALTMLQISLCSLIINEICPSAKDSSVKLGSARWYFPSEYNANVVDMGT